LNKKILPLGKLDHTLLEEFLDALEGHPRLIVGPKVGEDASVIDIGAKYLIVKSDPITFTDEKIGWYAVHINANDIACMGAKPKWFLITLLMPERKTYKSTIKDIFIDIKKACKELGVTICGGHTEITKGLDRPILCGQMLGEVGKTKLIQGSKAKKGDSILMTQKIPIEGSAILANHKNKKLLKTIDKKLLKRAARFLEKPGISVVEAAITAAKTGYIHSMHDPTEGGLATGIHELAFSSDLGALVNYELIPIYKEGIEICKALNINPLGLITSGTLLLTTSEKNEEKIIKTLKDIDIKTTRIGKLVDKKFGRKIRVGNKTKDLPFFQMDEISKVI
jgi:hydrogenase expression/formation protein HypE